MLRLSILILALLLAGACRRTPGPEPTSADQPRSQPRPEPDRLAELTGFYQAQGSESRLCIIGGGFGIVVTGQGDSSCGGSGRAVREAQGVRFTMQGDSACSFVARVSGRSLLIPDAIPAGCDYYCGSGATLAGARLAQLGAGRTAAVKARDMTGEPLCEDR